MARLSRYFLPYGIRRLARPILMELKLFARVWLNLLLPHRLLRYRRILHQAHKRLHVGCGSKRFQGWINLDMNPKGDLTLDLREGLPFADNSVELIYTEHALEHFYRETDGPYLLKECLRTLQPGGTIRITIPDAELYIRYYVGDLSPYEEAELASGHRRFSETRMDVVNSAFRWKHQHLYMYDEETLRELLESTGYAAIERMAYRKSSVEALSTLDLEERRKETLYMEARKPQRESA